MMKSLRTPTAVTTLEQIFKPHTCRRLSTMPLALAGQEAEKIVFREDRTIRSLVLNRSETGNAINLKAAKKINRGLKMWQHNDLVTAVIIRAEGDIFCSGLDLHRLIKNSEKAPALRRELCQIVETLHTYNKPVVSLLGGAALGGGGWALAGGARWAVAAPAASLAVPEPQLGLALDGGLSHALARLPQGEGALGLFAALSGRRLDGLDLARAGLATHLADAEQLPLLEEALADAAGATHGPAAIEAHLAAASRDVRRRDVAEAVREELGGGPGGLDAYAELAECFGPARGSVEEVARALEASPSAHAAPVLEALRAASPLALKVAFAQVRAARELLKGQGRPGALAACLRQEATANLNLQREPEFADAMAALEGGESYQWQKSLEDVTDEDVQRVLTVRDIQVE